MFIVRELESLLISSSWSNYRESYNSTRSRTGRVVLHQLHSSDCIDEEETKVAVY